ncbi:MAG: dihydrodipicolinate synthase family protein [Bacillota bacterium]|nr:dihydrodipicolinate synthase family protein [Bacillota bacterium]
MSGARAVTGIFAPIPTPFGPDEEIAYDRLAENLAWWGATRLRGVVVLGSNGEFVFLSPEEKARLIEAVRAGLPADKMVIAGTGCETTRDTIALSRQAAKLGADACLVLTPYYYKGDMTPATLRRYFWDVAEACPVPVMLYNMPRNTGLNMEPALVIDLASHPNITGIKDSSGNIVQISEIIGGTGEGFSVFAGSGSFLMTTLVMGGVGGTLAVANIMPDECAELMDLTTAGKTVAARALQQRILAPNKAVTSRWGIPGLKAALDLMGKHGGPPRRPLLPLGARERADLAKVLREAGVDIARPA